MLILFIDIIKIFYSFICWVGDAEEKFLSVEGEVDAHWKSRIEIW
jgi:hypothetical protein